MKVLVMEVKEFEESFPDIPGDDIGLTNHSLLGKDVYTFCWDPAIGRDDALGGKQELAKRLHTFRQQLETVRLQGENGYYIGGRYDVLIESEIVEEIKRIERFPELDHSLRCWKAWSWFATRAEMLDL